jgi:imidazolonepropionase-like amidohydrolase
MSAQGGLILFGSDTPSGSVYANPPGFNGYLELRAMEAAGLTPKQILSASTINNARLVGLAEQVGTIEIGKSADLILLDANPLVSMAAFDAIHTVILDGRAVPRGELDASSAAR